MSNLTYTSELPPLPSYSLRPVPPLIPGISDLNLSLILPVLAYWIGSLIFDYIDGTNFLDRYRQHTSAEELTRNTVSRAECIRGVLLNQGVQTILGVVLGYYGSGDLYGSEEHDVAVWAQRIRIAQQTIPNLLALIGLDAKGIAQNLAVYRPNAAAALMGGKYAHLTQTITGVSGDKIIVPAFAEWEMTLAIIIYWYIVPSIQFGVAIFASDSWQYFGHRWQHENRWLYKNVHAVHHRLYVPYAYGALYTHPLEGFFLDTCGMAVAFGVSGLSIRQGMWFYVGSTLKVVFDHAGYVLPWNPLRLISDNDAYFHDLHHQSWGVKSNFSIYTGFWDKALGTYWTDQEDAKSRYERGRVTAERKVELANIEDDTTSFIVPEYPEADKTIIKTL